MPRICCLQTPKSNRCGFFGEWSLCMKLRKPRKVMKTWLETSYPRIWIRTGFQKFFPVILLKDWKRLTSYLKSIQWWREMKDKPCQVCYAKQIKESNDVWGAKIVLDKLFFGFRSSYAQRLPSSLYISSLFGRWKPPSCDIFALNHLFSCQAYVGKGKNKRRKTKHQSWQVIVCQKNLIPLW